jgi:adenosylmethionine-8-amino-7-oxononanoate aminotransferase
MLLPVPHIAAPSAYRCQYCADQGGCTLKCADELERAIVQEGPETVAAFFAETIVGTSTPGIVPSPAYYRRIREICDRYDVLFVADEVLCGYGRCGSPFAISAWDVAPDIITLGKAIASGYAPLAAMVVAERIVDAIGQGTGRFVHGLTFSGTPSSCFIGLKVHEIMIREGLFTRAAEVGAVLEGALQKLAARHDIIGDIRGRGLLYGIEFVADRATRRPLDQALGVGRQIVEAMRARGVLVAQAVIAGTGSLGSDQIQISPPFTITEAEIATLTGALDEALTEITAHLRHGPGR